MSLSVSEVVRPFCEVVSSEDTTGPVTGMAISSLDKLLRAGIISECREWYWYNHMEPFLLRSVILALSG